MHADEAKFSAIAQGIVGGSGGVSLSALESDHFHQACDELEMFAWVGKASG